MSVDITSLLGSVTGVGVFTRELVDGLAEHPAVDLSVFAVSWRGRSGLVSAAPDGARVHTRPMPARLARAAWSQFDVPSARHLAGRSDIVHGPNFVVPPGGGAAEVVTVHDLTAIHHPEMCTPDVLEWPDLIRRAVARGAWIHTVSAFVAAEVRAAFPAAGERVVAVPNGIRLPGPAEATSDASAGRFLAGGHRYVLALGTVDPRKDLPSLVAAFTDVGSTDPDLRLVIAGPDGLGSDALDEAIAASSLHRRIVRLGWIDDHKRLALLRGATVVAYPSRYEGFGLVPLEAMAVGTPVVTTAAGAVPEVVGDAALVVPVGDHEALAHALRLVLHDEALAQDLADAGEARAQLFPWSATVDGIVDLYRRAADARA
ncbi:glycosyltransferase family 4 protein [Aquihabitans daechungensis]|uniref:glycosyltransferase family 4 protein n=1 Tax=Aquihabitans daechungensis TaxID=1052257 RepID=UPI003B9E97A3